MFTCRDVLLSFGTVAVAVVLEGVPAVNSSLLLVAGGLLSLLALPLSAFRTSRQPLSSSGLEGRVLAACERFPSLVAVSGLSEADFADSASRARFRSLPASDASSRRPSSSALALALALREEARERSADRIYVGAATPSDPSASWSRPRLSAGRLLLALTFGLASGAAAAAVPTLAQQLLLLAFGVTAAALSLVDVDTLLVDLPLLAVLSLLSLAALLPPVSGLLWGDVVRLFALPLFAAAGLSAAGSSALLLRRARVRRRLLLSFLLLFGALLVSLSAPYLLSLVALLEGRELSVVESGLSALPLLATAFLGRRMLLSSALVDSSSGPQLAPGPSAGVGDGDLLLLFPALLLASSFGGVSAALSALLLAPLLLMLMLPFRRLLMPSTEPASPSAPLPFGPPLLLAPLLVTAMSAGVL